MQKGLTSATFLDDPSSHGLLGRTRPAISPVGRVSIDWERLAFLRSLLLESLPEMPAYLLKPEVLAILEAEPDPRYRLLIDILWSTGARVSEALALTKSSFVEKGAEFGVMLKTLKQGRGRPRKASLERSPKRYVPITDPQLQERIRSFLWMTKPRQDERLFPMTRQTVNRHIHAAVDACGQLPFSVSAHTFRHAFAIHLVLHGTPLKYISKLLGHRSIESTEIYTNVLTFDGVHFLEGVDFH